jgi:hypothetical protein
MHRDGLPGGATAGDVGRHPAWQPGGVGRHELGGRLHPNFAGLVKSVTQLTVLNGIYKTVLNHSFIGNRAFIGRSDVKRFHTSNAPTLALEASAAESGLHQFRALLTNEQQ